MSDIKDLMKRAEEIRLQYEEARAKRGGTAWGIRDYAMGFMVDMGELQELIMAKENVKQMENVDEKLAHELADCLYSVLVIASYYGLDLEKEFDKTMDHIAERIAGDKL